MGLLEELTSSGNRTIALDFRQGSILDWSGNGNNCSLPTAGTMWWVNTPRGLAVKGTASGRMNIAAPSGINFVTGTLIGVAFSERYTMAISNMLFYKGGGAATLLNGYHFYLQPAGPTLALGDAVAFQTAPMLSVPSTVFGGRVNWYAFTWDGSRIKGYYNGVPVLDSAQTRIPSPAVSPAYVGETGISLNTTGLLKLDGINTPLSASQLMTIYNEWKRSPYIQKQARRLFVYNYPSKPTASEYAKKSIFFDTSFEVRAKSIPELTGSGYNGALVGIADPTRKAIYDTALRVDSTSSVNWGDIPTFNRLAKFTFIGRYRCEGLSANAFLAYKATSGTNGFYIRALTTGQVSGFWAAGGATSFASTATGIIKQGVDHHIAVVLDGTGATDADKAKLYVDGVLIPCTYTGPLPTAFGSLAGVSFYSPGFPTVAAGAIVAHSARMFTSALSAAEVLADYNESAQLCKFRETGEDLGVNLTNTTSGNISNSEWIAFSGTWAITQDTAGRKWLECISAGTAMRDAMMPSGTWAFTLYKGSDAGNTRLGICLARNTNIIGSATTGLNGYFVQFASAAANRVVSLQILTNGTGAAAFISSPNNFYVAGNSYDVVVTRRPSTSQWSIAIKGGIYTVWTQVNVPAVEATHWGTPSGYLPYLHFQAIAGDKLLLQDTRIGVYP